MSTAPGVESFNNALMLLLLLLLRTVFITNGQSPLKITRPALETESVLLLHDSSILPRFTRWARIKKIQNASTNRTTGNNVILCNFTHNYPIRVLPPQTRCIQPCPTGMQHCCCFLLTNLFQASVSRKIVAIWRLYRLKRIWQ